MTIDCLPVGAGYVRSEYSRRAGAQAVALDLLRVVCCAAGRLSRMRLQDAGLDPYSVGGIDPGERRERVGAEFGGYLVTDADPCEMTDAEMAACWPFDDVDRFGFAESREIYVPVFDSLCAMHGDAIDAPDCLAAGGCVSLSPLWFPGDEPPQITAGRERREAKIVAAPDVVWRDAAGRVVIIGDAQGTAYGLRVDSQFGEDGHYLRSMDSPDFIPAGSVVKGESCGEVTANVKKAMRDGWLK